MKRKMKRNNNRGRKRNIQKKTQQQQLNHELVTNIEKKTHQLLPQELITEILLRLPVKSLVRFKCVCKSWFSLISDPNFATSHFDVTTATHTHRLVLITDRTHETRSIDIEASLDDDAAIASLKLDFLLPQSYLNIKIGGSSRGFLFLYCDEDIYLWNPSTGVHKQIPCSPIMSDVDNEFDTYLYGFGCDPSTDDYLVVLGSYDDDDLTHFEFFSLRENIWKEIEGAHLPYIDTHVSFKVGTLFNGAIHWLAHRVDTSEIVIVSFDLTERRISEIAMPKLYDPLFCDLWVFGEFMSLWVMEDDGVGIWVMEEHGASSSWTWIFDLPIDEELDVNFYPICLTNYGDIIGSDGGNALVKYNDNGQIVEHRSYDGIQVAFYTESLLPIPLPRDS